MKLIDLIISFAAAAAVFCTPAYASGPAPAESQDPYAGYRTSWAMKAEQAMPELVKTVYRPLYLVEGVRDSSAYQGWRMRRSGELSDYYGVSLKQRPCVTVDFGKHITGRFSFRVRTLSRTQDAPLRLKFTFGEVPAEMNVPFDPFPGTLSRAWMQDEVITLEQIDCDVTLPRRISGRYMRVELLGGSPDFDFAMDDMWFTAESSAPQETVTELPADTPEVIRKINDVSVETLRECMQTVYEDGPKRDHRLWAGDLYLESLANRHSFRNFSLTKRCLYLFASLAAEDGTVVSNIFEKPEPHPQYGSYCLTYCLLYNSTLLEYLKDTGDYETAEDLWIVARHQVEDALTYVGDDYVFDSSRRPVWLFFDWREGLDADAPIQGAVIFALQQTYELAVMLGRESEVSHWPRIAEKMKKAAMKRYYDKSRGVFVSGPDSQVSVLGQTWMIKSGVVSGKQAQKAIQTALSDDSTVMPGTPYATHYLVDAMLICGMYDQARDYLTDYWGGMVEKGADTFWEAYDPRNDYISPYNFHPLNSYCHAWSCTPVYFIHTWPEVFLK